jgi:N-methylhydantoinase A
MVATDMGGTSFDVALVLEGRPELSDVSLAGRLHVAVPAVDIASIGAGGGSVAAVDADGGLHVGPRSMGAEPGPACYGRGGTEATVTDADLVLGRLDPDALLGGRIRLDRHAAERAIGAVARALGMDVVTAAAGIVRVADAKMADLVRRVTLERGHDPRRLVLVAYGGAAGLHAGAYGFDAGAREVVVPRHAAMLSAVGLALADPMRTFRRSGPASVPLDAVAVAEVFAELELEARAALDTDGVRPGSTPALRLRREVDFRYRRQTHHVTVPLDRGPITAARLERAVERFERRYEQVHGPGTGYRAAGIEAASFRLLASVARHAAAPRDAAAAVALRSRPARRAGRRFVRFDTWTGDTDIVDGGSLRPGDRIAGPALVQWPTTGVLVHPGHHATAGRGGHVHLARDG